MKYPGEPETLPAQCRAPHGARGLKCLVNNMKQSDLGRAPHGARGLKLPRAACAQYIHHVAPLTGRVD